METFDWYMARFKSMGMDSLRLSLWGEYVGRLDDEETDVALALLDQQLFKLCMDKMAQTCWRQTILRA